MLNADDYWLTTSIAFLRDIGIAVQLEPLSDAEFLPGVRIVGAGLWVDPSCMMAASDVLHEAGHIAVTPRAQREQLLGTVGPDFHFEWGGEVEAIAWSFAAATHLGMPLDELFHPLGYRGNASGLAFNFSLGVYPGAHGLCRTGLSLTPAQALEQGARPYPAMQRWLRED